jgi:RNA polymerase sigma-70 factor, ECF subfamily
VPAKGVTGSVDPKHAELLSAFMAASRSGDLQALTSLLASDATIVTDVAGRWPRRSMTSDRVDAGHS